MQLRPTSQSLSDRHSSQVHPASCQFEQRVSGVKCILAGEDATYRYWYLMRQNIDGAFNEKTVRVWFI
ncbi:hypothetical protein PM082_007032 [Marasmius tenuissimus]|nr:hypothetical protein PM082_007032 [Marasmius tenuissimus]